jgi:hypothetical protein
VPERATTDGSISDWQNNKVMGGMDKQINEETIQLFEKIHFLLYLRSAKK